MHIIAQTLADFDTLGGRHQARPQITGADGVDFVEQQFPSRIEAGGGHSKRERQKKAQQAEDAADHGADWSTHLLVGLSLSENGETVSALNGRQH